VTNEPVGGARRIAWHCCIDLTPAAVFGDIVDGPFMWPADVLSAPARPGRQVEVDDATGRAHLWRALAAAR
jgi:hypothetical protein